MVGLTYLEHKNLYALDEHDVENLGVNEKTGLYDDYIINKQYELNESIEKILLVK